MQSYNINLKPNAPAHTINASARRFVYESGKNVPEGSDTRIVVKPDTGNEIVLRAGQSFALEPGVTASTWYVRAFDPAQGISGTVIIGSGEFDDNSLKVDANSGAIQVEVVKDAALMTATHFRSGMGLPAATFTALVLPAENVRGVIVENAFCTRSAENVELFVSPGVPAGNRWMTKALSWDLASQAGNWKRVLLEPGQGLYAFCVPGSTQPYGILFTVL